MKPPHYLFMITRFSSPNDPRYITKHSEVMYRGITDDVSLANSSLVYHVYHYQERNYYADSFINDMETKI